MNIFVLFVVSLGSITEQNTGPYSQNTHALKCVIAESFTPFFVAALLVVVFLQANYIRHTYVLESRT